MPRSSLAQPGIRQLASGTLLPGLWQGLAVFAGPRRSRAG
jgi:hypothetical protein